MTYDLLPSLENGNKLYVIRESFCVTYVYNLSLSKCYDNSCAQTFRMPSHDAYLRIEGSDQSGVLHNKRNREQKTENKNFNLSDIMYCEIHNF